MWDWLRKLFKRKKAELIKTVEIHTQPCSDKSVSWTASGTVSKDGQLRAPVARLDTPFYEGSIGETLKHHTFVEKSGRQATRQDVGKFMKHGRQLKNYRQSIKAKKKPEED